MNSVLIATMFALSARAGVSASKDPLIPGRCIGQCGSWEVQWDHDTGKPCACDDLCKKRNDCCSDFFDACGSDMSKYSSEYGDEDLDRVVIDGEQEAWSDEYSEQDKRLARDTMEESGAENSQLEKSQSRSATGASTSLSKLDRIDENEFAVEEDLLLESEEQKEHGSSQPLSTGNSKPLIPRSIAMPMLISFIVIVVAIGAVSVTKRFLKGRLTNVDAAFMVLPTTHPNNEFQAFHNHAETTA